MAVDTQVVDAEQLIVKHLDLWTSAQTAKSTAGRGSNNKIELTGIKKLRELILELAVRGKLVPQDPNDEPASELLSEIKSARLELLKSGKIKNLKDLTSISIDDEAFQPPKGWVFVRFGDIAIIERGGSPRPIQDFITEEPDGLNWIKIGDTDQGGKFITTCQEKIKKEGLVKTRMVYPGDFLLTNSMSFGRPYITLIEGCIHDGWLRISPPESINKDYLYLLLSSPFIKRAFQKSAAGAVVLNLNADKVREVLLPIPPRNEQLKLSQKVQELMALCDQLEQQSYQSIDAHNQLVDTLLQTLVDSANAEELASNWQRLSDHFDTLFTTEYSIDALKQTILQLAVMGKLVKQDPTDEPASELLKRIAKEKEALVKAGKIKKQKPLPAITEDEKPFELPKGWEWIQLGDVHPEFQNGASSRGDSNGIDVVVFRLADITDLKISEADTRTLQIDGSSLDKYNLLRDDILIVRVNGSAELVGRFVHCHKKYDAIYCDHFIRMRLNTSPFISEFLVETSNSKLVRHAIQGLFVSTAGQKTVNQTHISSLLLPVPPLNEQIRIINKIKELGLIFESLATQITEAKQSNVQLANAFVERMLA